MVSPGPIAASGILLGFQIADLDFASGFWFFLCLRLLVQMSVGCFVAVVSEVYCPESGPR
jgi:hypothetical protein